jgi:hypothetical protein
MQYDRSCKQSSSKCQQMPSKSIIWSDVRGRGVEWSCDPLPHYSIMQGTRDADLPTPRRHPANMLQLSFQA